MKSKSIYRRVYLLISNQIALKLLNFCLLGLFKVFMFTKKICKFIGCKSQEKEKKSEEKSIFNLA